MFRYLVMLLSGTALVVSVAGAPRIDDDVPTAEAVTGRGDTGQSMRSFSASGVVRASNERVQHDTEILAPLHFTDDGNRLIFANVVHNLRDGGEVSFSAGAGVRFYLPGRNSVLGFHILGDSTETLADNDIAQLGLGFDFFAATGIDLHGNLYLPESDDRVASQWTDYGDLFATGHTIFQTENLLTIFERGRKGADLKVKFDVPMLNKILPARGHVGAYHFDGGYGDDLTGAMAGIMVQPFRGAAFGAEYYGDDEFFGEHWVFVAGVSGPIEFDTLVKPKKLLAGIARAFSIDPAPRDRSSDGMRDFLVHRLDRRNWVLQEWSAPAVTESTDLVIEENVIFVNNGLPGSPVGSATGRGTFEDPVNTVQTGVARSAASFGNGGTVLVAGTGQIYAEEVFDVGSGFHLRSGHLPFTGQMGKTFTYGTQPILDGGVIVDDVQNFALSGFEVRNGALSLANPDAVFASNVAEISIVGNTIRSAAQDGIDIEVSGTNMSNAVVSGNQVFGSGDENFDLDVEDSGSLSVVYSDNVSRDSSGDGFGIDVDDFGVLDLLWTGGGIFNSGGDGFFLNANDDSSSTVVVRNTTIAGTGIDGFSISADDDSIVNASLLDSSVSGTDFDGVFLDAFSDSTVTLSVRRNVFMDIPDEAVDLEIFEGANATFVVADNEIDTGGFAGIEVELGDLGTAQGLISNNVIDSTENGIGLFLGDGSLSRIRVLDNQVTADGGFPLFIPVFGAAVAELQIANNVFASTAGGPVVVLSDDIADLDLQFFGNTSSVDADFDEFGGTFELEDPLGSNIFNGGAVFTVDPNIDIVPFGTFGFPDP